MGMRSDSSKPDHDLKADSKKPKKLERKDTISMLQMRRSYMDQRIKAAIKEYRLIRPGQILEFFTNQKRYDF